MTLRNKFLTNTGFHFKNDLFYQTDFKPEDAFENAYNKLRATENRKLPDEIVKKLPGVEKNNQFKKEWDMRKSSMEKIIYYIKQKRSRTTILELGSGNGWLAHRLAVSLDSEVCGVDINESELLQGARVFNNIENLIFIHGDIFSAAFEIPRFDHIILAGAIQYFSDFNALINKLLSLLLPKGEIHIFDSPVYCTKADINKAKKRSTRHFEGFGLPEMSKHYHHHDWKILEDFNYEVLYNPVSLVNKVKRKLINKTLSPFPWIKIEC